MVKEKETDSNDAFPKIHNEDLNASEVPCSIANPLNSLMQTISEQAGPGLFLDICAGANRPLSLAIMQAGGNVCTFDILVHREDNLLSDECYEALLRLSCSRQVRYGCGSPLCCEYSRLKLRPGFLRPCGP